MIISRIWKQQPGEFFCVSTKDPENNKWVDHFFKKRDLDKVDAFIKENKERNVYFCPMGFSKPRRVKEAVVAPRLLWSDMDESDPRHIKIKPTIAIESSPGRFVGLWLTDKPITEDLNRRLTYLLGSDKSGWDFTQVLRAPGSINHKYDERPRAKILWSDGPSWKISDIELALPKEDSVASFDSSKAADLYRKWERKLSPFFRRCFMTLKDPPAGKRSEVFFRLVQELLERGVPRDEGCTMLKACKWNKYAGRPNEDREILRAWDKGINKKVNGEPVGEAAETSAPVRLTDIEFKPLSWLWYPRIARNAINIIAGEGGVGKGIVSCHLAATVTKGAYFPCSKERLSPGNVLWCEGEDSVPHVVKPRLDASGADERRVFITNPTKFIDYDIGAFIREHKIKLIVLSPFISFLEGLEDANKQIDVRHALEHLDSIIQDTDCAIIGIMHRNKKKDVSAVERVMGSVEFANYARNVITIDKEDDDFRRFHHAKMNLGPQAPDLLFRTVNRKEKQFPTGQFIGADWMPAERTIHSHEAFTRREDTSSQSAGDWLMEFLADGSERLVADVHREGEKMSHSANAINRARGRLGKAIAHRQAGRGKVYWRATGERTGAKA
jgi:hypothetical protein